jgi:hypothetical protein
VGTKGNKEDINSSRSFIGVKTGRNNIEAYKGPIRVFINSKSIYKDLYRD